MERRVLNDGAAARVLDAVEQLAQAGLQQLRASGQEIAVRLAVRARHGAATRQAAVVLGVPVRGLAVGGIGRRR